MLQCETCWSEFEEDELEAQWSDSEPGCPYCGGTNITESEEE